MQTVHVIARILDIAITIYIWVIIIRALISWVNPDPYNPIVQLLNRVTEPVLGPVRRKMPFFGGIDLSPIIVILFLFFLNATVVRMLYQIAATDGSIDVVDVLMTIFSALAMVVSMIINFFIIIMIIRTIVSWVNADPFNMFVRVIYGVTEPFLRPIRRYIHPVRGLDVAPVVVILVLVLINILIYSVLVA